MKTIYSVEKAINDYQIAKCNKELKFNNQYSIIFEALELLLDKKERVIFRNEFLVMNSKEWWTEGFEKQEYLNLRMEVHKKIIKKMKDINLEEWVSENNKKV